MILIDRVQIHREIWDAHRGGFECGGSGCSVGKAR